MMGAEAPETCWATHKRQVLNLWNCCILLVDLFESYDDARTCERQTCDNVWSPKHQTAVLAIWKSALQITTLPRNICGQALVFLGDIRVVPLPKFLHFWSVINYWVLTACWQPQNNQPGAPVILCTPTVKKSTAVGTLCTYPCVLIVLHMAEVY